jgi:hypothetical protein
VLAQEPEEQITFAVSLLDAESNASVLQAALTVLEQAYEDAPPPTLRPALLGAYARLRDGGGDDQGCYARAAILRLLRPLALPADAPLLERAAATYEFLPPGRSEVGAGLRSAALIALDEADPQLAGYHATRLLTDQHTSTMSGEPAVTAVRVLAARGALLPLYAFLLGAEPEIPDVVAECLRNLAPIPPSVLTPLVDRYLASEDEIVLLGLFDLLLAHETRDDYVDTILAFLRATRLYNLYRYLVSAIVAGRFKTLIAGVTAMAATESDPRKCEILREALSLR